jgi:NADH-quinone oxidoreductase subunit L
MDVLNVAIVFLPFLGAIIAGFFGRWIGDRASQIIPCALLGLSGLLSIIVFFDVAIGGNARTTELFTWIDSGSFELSWAIKVDTLTSVMFLVVANISALIHVYSIGYMSHDKSIPRFFSYLSLFTFFMLMLVCADNFVQMFFGWEGVGLCSYLLIGFWYQRPSACAAAIKAFLVNRVGDVGFALGIMGTFVLFGAVGFDEVFGAVPDVVGDRFVFLGMELDALTTICILLFIGAMGKSAQLGLHTWLPDAMEGPTPVSALIHAATMVTAGVFMVCRLSPMFEYAPVALELVTYVGAFTAFFAATIGLTQFDIKRVIAYSIPPHDPRLLQGALVPGLRLGDPRHVGRAGHAQDGRPLQDDPGDLRGHDDRLRSASRHRYTGHADWLRGFLLQGHYPGGRLRGP